MRRRRLGHCIARMVDELHSSEEPGDIRWLSVSVDIFMFWWSDGGQSIVGIWQDLDGFGVVHG